MSESASFWDTVVNTTPHDIHLYKNGEVWKTIPTSPNHELRMTTEQGVVSDLEGFPVTTKPKFLNIEGLMPNGPILVSMLVGDFLANKRQNVYGPDTGPASVVRSKEGTILGTKLLIKYSTI